MTKLISLISLVSLIVLFVLGSMAPASAQGRMGYRGDSDCIVRTTGGECFVPAAGGIYDRNYRSYDYGRYRRHFDDYGDLDWNPYGYYGRYDQYRRFEPILDACGRQYKTRGARVWEGAAKIGATTVLGAILGGGKGAGLGAATGGAWVAYDQSRYYSNPDQACGALGSDGGVSNSQGPTGPAIGGQPLEPQGGYTLINDTDYNVWVYDGDTYVGVMRPKQSWPVGLPKESFRGIAKFLNRQGQADTIELNREPGSTSVKFKKP